METSKIRKITDKVANEMKCYYAEDGVLVDPEKVIDKLYKGLSFKREDKDLVDLIVKLRIDNSIGRLKLAVTDIIKKELKPIQKDIMHIKRVVGCNGD